MSKIEALAFKRAKEMQERIDKEKKMTVLDKIAEYNRENGKDA